MNHQMKKHRHNWQLADYVHNSVIDGSEYAIFVCECGLAKHVNLKRRQS